MAGLFLHKREYNDDPWDICFVPDDLLLYDVHFWAVDSTKLAFYGFVRDISWICQWNASNARGTACAIHNVVNSMYEKGGSFVVIYGIETLASHAVALKFVENPEDEVLAYYYNPNFGCFKVADLQLLMIQMLRHFEHEMGILWESTAFLPRSFKCKSMVKMPMTESEKKRLRVEGDPNDYSAMSPERSQNAIDRALKIVS